mmetsp:Transcript_103157/g.295970  ORF Transcript_103157/g.295970 Transcript_103157/m.295970 type:complete len:129 (+) Transcript_103157:272-658(+)
MPPSKATLDRLCVVDGGAYSKMEVLAALLESGGDEAGALKILRQSKNAGEAESVPLATTDDELSEAVIATIPPAYQVIAATSTSSTSGGGGGGEKTGVSGSGGGEDESKKLVQKLQELKGTASIQPPP